MIDGDICPLEAPPAQAAAGLHHLRRRTTMALRLCATPGCSELVPNGHCATHRRTREQQRGTATARGYGHEHQSARRALITQLPTPCAYGCGTIITTPTQLVAAHIEDGNPTAGWQPSCVRCNQRAKTR